MVLLVSCLGLAVLYAAASSVYWVRMLPPHRSVRDVAKELFLRVAAPLSAMERFRRGALAPPASYAPNVRRVEAPALLPDKRRVEEPALLLEQHENGVTTRVEPLEASPDFPTPPEPCPQPRARGLRVAVGIVGRLPLFSFETFAANVIAPNNGYI